MDENVRKYKRVIFVAGNGIARAPMAAEIFKTIIGADSGIEVLARGLIVAFPEPLNQKTEAVMIAGGIDVPDFRSKEIEDSEITEDTILFTMEESQRQRLLEKLERATEDNTFLVTDYVGEELEVMDPYGGTLQTYGLCFEGLQNTLRKVAARLMGGDADRADGTMSSQQRGMANE